MKNPLRLAALTLASCSLLLMACPGPENAGASQTADAGNLDAWAGTYTGTLTSSGTCFDDQTGPSTVTIAVRGQMLDVAFAALDGCQDQLASATSSTDATLEGCSWDGENFWAYQATGALTLQGDSVSLPVGIHGTQTSGASCNQNVGGTFSRSK